MKQLAALFSLITALSLTAAAQNELKVDDPSQLAGKKLNVLRAMLCQPNTFTANLNYSGKVATVVSVKPGKGVSIPARTLNRMPPESRALFEDQMKAATLLLQFEDGTKLDTCAPIGPKKIAEYFELAPGETLGTAAPPKSDAPSAGLALASTGSSPASAGQAASSTPAGPQECPVVMTKVSSSESFGHALADAMTTSEFERQVDRAGHGGKDKHYLDMRERNNGQKPIRAIESVVVYKNVMGDETVRDTLTSQNTKPIKPGEELKSYFMDRGLQSSNGVGDVTVYVQRVRFTDDTLWVDNGSHSCSLTAQIKR